METSVTLSISNSVTGYDDAENDDYSGVTVVTFVPPNEMSCFNITFPDDTEYEFDEAIKLTINTTGSSLNPGTISEADVIITDDDRPQIRGDNTTIFENKSPVGVCVDLRGATQSTSQDLTITFTPQLKPSAANQASPDEDFNSTVMTEVIQPGQTQVCVDIIIANDIVEEGDEEFCVQLSSDNNDIDLGSEPCHICVTIVDPTTELSPTITPTYGKFTLGVTRNNSIDISVNITAIPPVNPSAIQWYFNSMLIEEHNKSNKHTFCCGKQSLTILNAQQSDAGIYEITVGSSSINITLNVYVEAALLNKNGIVTTKETGEIVTFNCTADGINTPKIMWRRNGQLLFNTTRLKIISFNKIEGFRPIPGTQQITSSLIISDLKVTDSGIYSCTTDNEARTPVSLSSPFVLTVSSLPPTNYCSNSPCLNGRCHSLSDNYLCTCGEGYTGHKCELKVLVYIPPTIEIHPVDTIGELYQSVSLTCTASGNPIPKIIWYKDNISIPNTNSNTSVLIINELNLNDRGFYHCEAKSIINGKNESDASDIIVLNIKGIVQYEAIIQLHSQFPITDLIHQINEHLSGTSDPTNDVTFFLVGILYFSGSSGREVLH